MTVTVVPLTETVATDVLFDDADIVPVPFLVTVILPVVDEEAIVNDVGLMLSPTDALPIVQLTFLAVVVPSDHA